MKNKIIVVTLLFLIFSSISWLFWKQEIRYWLPTPIPDGYVAIPDGSLVKIDFLENSNNHKLLHFYNPECPCSNFNFTSFNSILKTHNNDFDFYLIIQADVKNLKSSMMEDLERLNVKIVVDTGQQIAKSCGVYSTPQIAIINNEGKIYYKGNYNKARYCTQPASNYAQIAIDSLLSGKDTPHFPIYAKQAYGCELTKNN